MISRSLICLRHILVTNGSKNFMTSVSIRAEASKSDTALGMKKESQRMHEFHEKLKADRLPYVKQSMRLVDLVLVEIDPKSGELVPNSEKEPTKWGDWQHSGRVSDF